MIVIFNTDLKVKKDSKDGTYTVSIEGSLYLTHVSREKRPSSSYYFLLERGMFFILRSSDDKMVARCALKSRDSIKDDCIHGTWEVYKPAVKKTHN